MSDSYTEVTSQSWFGRIGGSIKGILFGLILIPVALVVLWWNEGRAVTTANSLKEGAAAVISVAADKVDSANEKKLIHVTGEVKAGELVADTEFGMSAPVLRLERKEEIYQWVENTKTETKTKMGGGEETTTTYTYEKKWVDDPVDSSRFKQPADHANKGDLLAGNARFNAADVTLGAFRVTDSLVGQIDSTTSHPVTDEDIDKLPQALKAAARIESGSFYFGEKKEGPQVGDQRVSYEVVKPGTFSVISAQNGDSFEPYQTKAGDPISMIESGSVSAEAMFQNAASANTVMTWLIRLGGFLLMTFGFMAIMRPLSVLGSVVPFIGSIIGAGTSFIALVLAGTISLFVIALAWLAARPVLGVILLALAVGGFIVARRLAARTRTVATTA